MSIASRRDFLRGAALMASALGVPGGAALARAPFIGVGPGVGAIFNEQVYLDRSGRVPAYRPPLGARGLAATAELDEVAFRMAHPYI